MRDQPITDISPCATHNTHRRQTSKSMAEFEPAIPVSDCRNTL